MTRMRMPARPSTKQRQQPLASCCASDGGFVHVQLAAARWSGAGEALVRVRHVQGRLLYELRKPFQFCFLLALPKIQVNCSNNKTCYINLMKSTSLNRPRLRAHRAAETERCLLSLQSHWVVGVIRGGELGVGCGGEVVDDIVHVEIIGGWTAEICRRRSCIIELCNSI